VDTLCLDVPPAEFKRECAFWSALTRWDQYPARVPGFVYLQRPPGLAAQLLLQQLERTAPGQRVTGHVDFGCADEHALSLHVGLGARVVGAHPYWTVLADPAGREYCLVDREPDDGR
jgi:Glyoxalase-like domain